MEVPAGYAAPGIALIGGAVLWYFLSRPPAERRAAAFAPIASARGVGFSF